MRRRDRAVRACDALILCRTAAALATVFEVAQQQLHLPKLLAQERRYALTLVDEVDLSIGYCCRRRLCAYAALEAARRIVARG